MAYVADPGPETALGPLQQAACTYRIAFGPRAGQKVLSFQTVSTREPPPTPVRCVDAQGFSLDAEVCCAAHERKQLEHLCRMGTLRMPPASIQKSFVPSVSRSRAFGVLLQVLRSATRNVVALNACLSEAFGGRAADTTEENIQARCRGGYYSLQQGEVYAYELTTR